MLQHMPRPAPPNIFMAVKMGDFPAFREFGEAMDVAGLDEPEDEGHTLVHWASKRHDTRYIEYLKDRGCALDAVSKDAVGMQVR